MATDLQIAERKVFSLIPATRETLRELECGSQPEVHESVAPALKGALLSVRLFLKKGVLLGSASALLSPPATA